VRHFEGEFLADGYMDVPVALLAFFSVYLLLEDRSAQQSQSRQLLWFSALAAAAAALTKQSGVYILAIWPLLAWLLAARRADSLRPRDLWPPFVLALLFAGSFYLYRSVIIGQGLDSDNTAYLLGEIHRGRDMLQRLQNAWLIMGRYGYMFLVCLLALPWQKPALRWITLLVLLPFTLLWMLFYSYDERNLAIALPFAGMLAGAALERAIEFALSLTSRIPPRWVPAALLPLLAGLLLTTGSLALPNARLLAAQDAARREVFNPELNRQLYAYFEANGLEGQILTNYPVDFLPGLQGKQRSFWYNEADVFLSELNNPANRYLLVPANASDNVRELVRQRAAAGQIQPVFETQHGYLPFAYF